MAFWVMFFISLAISVAGELLRPKQKFDDAKPSAIGDFQFPTADATRVIPYFVGTVKLSGPNTTWFGDYTMVPIVKTVKTGWFSEDTFVQAYQHLLGVQLVFGWGVLDSMAEWIADDKPVKITRYWENADEIVFGMNDPTFISADEPWSGLQGTVRLYKGTTTQMPNAYLAAQWSDEPEISAFRRLCYAVLEKCWIGNSETPPPFGIIGTRLPNSLGLTGGKHNVDGDANIACAAYEVMTDMFIGLKIDPLKIDKPSFIAGGNTLFDEGLGVSMVIDTAMVGKELLGEYLRHADGVIYPDPVTGLYTFKLARDDYDVDVIDEFDDSNVELEGFEFSRTSWEETRNQITVNYTNRAENFQPRPVTWTDDANVDIRRGTIDPESLDFLGFSKPAQGMHAAQRAGKTRSSPIMRASFVTNRDGYALRVGSVIKLTKTEFKIFGVVCRVIDISYGTLDDPSIRVTVCEDVFHVNAQALPTPPASGWIPPGAPGGPVAVLVRKALDEVPYEMMGAEARHVMALGTREDSSTTIGFEVWTDPTGGSTFAQTATSRGTIASGLLQAVYSDGDADDTTGFVVTNVEDPTLLRSVTDSERANGAALLKIGNEYMAYKNISVVGDTVTVTGILRGVFDTIQGQSHAAGATVWFLSSAIPLTSTAPYAADITLKAKLLAFDRTRRQDITTETALTQVTQSRALRPSPPGKVRLNSQSRFVVNGTGGGYPVAGAATLTWEHRNKTLRKCYSQDATGITSEAGVTYEVEVRNASTNALVVSKAGLSGDSAVLDLITGNYKVNLFAVNTAGLRSLYAQDFGTLNVTNASGTNTIGGVVSPPTTTPAFEPVRVVALQDITLSGLQTINGVVLGTDDRVLVVDQYDETKNGIYLAKSGAWVRAPDANETIEFVGGKQVYVTAGTPGATTLWALATTGTVTIGTTDILWIQIGGPAVGGVIIDGGTPGPTPPPTTPDTPSGGAGMPGGFSPTVRTRGATVINVETHGADPTGVADSTAAIQAAINALPSDGGTVRFNTLNGRYKVNPNVMLQARSFMLFDAETMDVTIFASPETAGSTPFVHRDILQMIGVNNVEWRGGVILGFRDWYDATGGKAAHANPSYPSDEWGHGIFIGSGSYDITIRDVSIGKCTGDGISTGYSTHHIEIHNVLSERHRRQGLSIGGDYVKCTNSIFQDIGIATGTSPRAGVDIESDNGNTAVGNEFQNCIFRRNAGPGIELYQRSTGTIINNCTVEDNSGMAGIYAYDALSATITNNLIKNNDHPGIYLNGATHSVTVSGNDLINNRTDDYRQPPPNTSTVNKTGTSDPLVSRHIRIASTATGNTVGTNTYGPVI